MQNFIDNSFQHLSAFYLILTVSVIIGLSGCENPGSVGSDIGNQQGEIVTDTLFVEGMQAISPVSYSGDLQHFSAGQYNDPLFGEVSATALVKPIITPDTMEADAQMFLRLQTPGGEYGDTLANQEFDIYEVTELWRAAALKANDQVSFDQNNAVASFTVGDEDSLTVELSSEWVDKYYQYSDTTNADSLYKYNFYGLAISPRNSGRVIPWSAAESEFSIINPSEDTFRIALNQHGYTVGRDNSSSMPQGSLPVFSTFENILNFGSLGLEELGVEASAVSKVELVLYRNNEAMEQSLQSEPNSVHRPDSASLSMHLAESAYLPENIDPGAPAGTPRRAQGSYSQSEGAYYFDVTNMARGILQAGIRDGEQFYITLPNDGILRQELFYTNTDQVPADKRPRIIITALKNTNNSR